MKTISLIAEKGGSGKTSIGVHMAVCGARRGLTVALIDLDPQGSAADWSERRADDADPVSVIKATPVELPRLKAVAEQQGADLLIIDTAGRSDMVTHQALAVSDFALTPCRPSIFDLASARKTVGIIEGVGKKTYVVLNACPPRGSRAQETREALEAITTVAPVALTQLVAYSDALNDGRSVEELEPGGKAAREISTLYDWVISV